MIIGATIISSFIRQTGSLEEGLAMYVGAGFDTSHPHVYKVKYELGVFRDYANGIVRNIPDPSASWANKSTAAELEEAPTAPVEDAEK